ncbi:MAG: DoxX family protein [Terracidiphilus sp.]
MSRRIGYWICTGLLALWLVPSGVLDILRVPAVVEILHHLGYPAYVGVILGVGKLLAIAAILTPQTRLLREWAYAGITFDLIGAFISHMVVRDPLLTAVTPLLVLGLAAGSYSVRADHLRLRSV